MNKEERRLKDPLSLRFEDWNELYMTWGICEKAIAIIFSPLVFPFVLFYTIFCETSYFIQKLFHSKQIANIGKKADSKKADSLLE